MGLNPVERRLNFSGVLITDSCLNCPDKCEVRITSIFHLHLLNLL